ncbi:YfgM family protein [Pseudoxanthomonas mexicana]|uniref:YfgM family protein n=1 Tax=Pseudoxanthomonas mexicana TaxID=128785 RepID=UPI00398A7ADF
MAIDDLLDEHEQSERVRSWLRNNATTLVGGVALGLAVILGWQWWQKHLLGSQQKAHADYQAAVESIAGGDLEKARSAIAGLSDKKIYAELAALRLARAQAEAGQTDAALATLRGIDPEPALQSLVNVRLARLLTESGKPADAVTLLAGATDAAGLEARGDALLVTGKQDEARDAYSRALTALDVAAPQRRLLEIKLADTGGLPTRAEEQG